jgi:hypothetical protein
LWSLSSTSSQKTYYFYKNLSDAIKLELKNGLDIDYTVVGSGLVGLHAALRAKNIRKVK